MSEEIKRLDKILYKKYVFFIQWFVYKQNALQNIPFWEHKRSSSVILSRRNSHCLF